jgi:hypothetical protein
MKPKSDISTAWGEMMVSGRDDGVRGEMLVSELHASRNMRIPNKTIAPALTAGG